MSDIQRWVLKLDGEIVSCSLGNHVLHADLLKIFAWIVEHEVTFRRGYLDWFDGKGWLHQGVPDGDFLGVIVKLMGGDE